MLTIQIAKQAAATLKRMAIRKIEFKATYATSYDLFCYFNACIEVTGALQADHLCEQTSRINFQAVFLDDKQKTQETYNFVYTRQTGPQQFTCGFVVMRVSYAAVAEVPRLFLRFVRFYNLQSNWKVFIEDARKQAFLPEKIAQSIPLYGEALKFTIAADRQIKYEIVPQLGMFQTKFPGGIVMCFQFSDSDADGVGSDALDMPVGGFCVKQVPIQLRCDQKLLQPNQNSILGIGQQLDDAVFCYNANFVPYSKETVQKIAQFHSAKATPEIAQFVQNMQYVDAENRTYRIQKVKKDSQTIAKQIKVYEDHIEESEEERHECEQITGGSSRNQGSTKFTEHDPGEQSTYFQAKILDDSAEQQPTFIQTRETENTCAEPIPEKHNSLEKAVIRAAEPPSTQIDVKKVFPAAHGRQNQSRVLASESKCSNENSFELQPQNFQHCVTSNSVSAQNAEVNSSSPIKKANATTLETNQCILNKKQPMRAQRTPELLVNAFYQKNKRKPAELDTKADNEKMKMLGAANITEKTAAMSSEKAVSKQTNVRQQILIDDLGRPVHYNDEIVYLVQGKLCYKVSENGQAKYREVSVHKLFQTDDAETQKCSMRIYTDNNGKQYINVMGRRFDLKHCYKSTTPSSQTTPSLSSVQRPANRMEKAGSAQMHSENLIQQSGTRLPDISRRTRSQQRGKSANDRSMGATPVGADFRDLRRLQQQLIDYSNQFKMKTFQKGQ